MSKTLFKNIIVYIMMLTLILTGCGKTLQIIDKESSSSSKENEMDLAENMDEEIPEGNPKEKENGTLLDVLTGLGTQEISTNKWPKELNDIPEFVYGELIRAEKNYDEYDGIDYEEYRFQFENIDNDAGEDYSKDLEKAGFEISQAPRNGENPLDETTFVEYDFSRFELEVNDLSYSIQADFWIDSEDEGALFISIPSVTDGNSNHGSNDDEDKEADNDDEYEDEDRGKIADDYPHKDAPFYSGQLTLELATDVMIGDMKVYSVIFSTSDDIEKVKEEIIDTYTTSDYEVIVNMEQMGALTLMVEKNKYNIMITVAEDEGFDEATMVQYSVSPSDD